MSARRGELPTLYALAAPRMSSMKMSEELVAELIFDDLADAGAAEIALCGAGFAVESAPIGTTSAAVIVRG